MNKKNLIFLLFTPIDALARGGSGIEGIVFFCLVFLAVVVWYKFWILILSFPFFIYEFFFRLFKKNVREQLISFGVGGFWYTYAFPFIFFLTSYPNLEWYFNCLLSALFGLTFWFLVVYYLSYKEDSWNRNDK